MYPSTMELSKKVEQGIDDADLKVLTQTLARASRIESIFDDDRLGQIHLTSIPLCPWQY